VLYNSYTSLACSISSGLKPIITVCSGGSASLTKKFEGYIEAAFWIGLEHSEGDLESVKARQPNESYGTDVANLLEFCSLLVRREISFSIEFFEEPSEPGDSGSGLTQEPSPSERETSAAALEEEADYKAELDRLRDDYSKDLVNRRQYESRKGVLLKKWRKSVEGRLSS
jgi:hypothetical protein